MSVDFKTDQEFATELDRYRGQVSIYAMAISEGRNVVCDVVQHFPDGEELHRSADFHVAVTVRLSFLWPPHSLVVYQLHPAAVFQKVLRPFNVNSRSPGWCLIRSLIHDAKVFLNFHRGVVTVVASISKRIGFFDEALGPLTKYVLVDA
jgi:hypothetical protein